MTDHLVAFINAVFRNCTSGGGVHLYAFKHDDSRVADESQRVELRDLASMRAMIERSAARRSPSVVFCPPVCLFGSGKGTKTANILEAPVIALELDDNPTEARGIAEAILGPATLVVRSGGVTAAGEDKLHLYWRLTQPARTPAEQAALRAIRMQLIAVTGGDSTGGPLVHPMRWPGSWHTKGVARLCEIAESTDRELTLQEATDAMSVLGDMPSVRPLAPRDGWKTPEPLSEQELARLAGAIPNDGLTWADWNRMGMVFFDASHGSDEGLAAFHAWSEKDHRYDSSETEARWSHWYNSPPSDLGAGSLYRAAGEHTQRLTGEEMFGDAMESVLAIEPPARTRARQQGFQPHDGDVMHADQQVEYFKDCIYIKKFKVVIMPDGSESDHSQFDDTMGGQRFILTNDGKTTKSAWEALMRNERYKAPWVHNTCFRPEERPLTIIEEDGWKLVNTYMPINPPAISGDPSPWLDHLCKLYPDDNDRKLLLSWMASCILNPGKKFQWWPVLIGAKGNAKTMILNIMEYCIGSRYTHLPNAGKMTRNGINFNGWIRGKLFLGVDEVYSANRRDFLEEFKPYVTNRRLPIESKGVDEFTGDNRANGIMTSNHWDGVPIDENERRYGVFFTAQQTYQDCVRDGLTSTYFSRLWAWLDRDGFAIINHYLRNYPLEAEYDPAQLSTRAPKTTSTSLAIAASLGSVEQEIEAAIEEGRAGFLGGWISSKALDSLFSEKGIKIARNKRINLVRALGYDLHPALHEGKTPSVVMPDGVRCRLYCLKESEEWEITMPGAVAERYTGAQSGT